MESVSSPVLTDWHVIFSIELTNGALEVKIGALLAALVALIFATALLARRHSGGWQVTSADFTFAGCATMTICPTDDVAGIAHQAWVEITTRKAALPFDEENDVIVEIYNSWYELFKALRELAKGVPTRRGLRDGSDEAQLVEVLILALNEGLRPHLTQWQARFRRWYAEQVADERNEALSPQEIQRGYPQYDEMVESLKSVNAGLQTFAETLRKLAHDRKRVPWWHVLPTKVSSKSTARGTGGN